MRHAVLHRRRLLKTGQALTGEGSPSQDREVTPTQTRPVSPAKRTRESTPDSAFSESSEEREEAMSIRSGSPQPHRGLSPMKQAEIYYDNEAGSREYIRQVLEEIDERANQRAAEERSHFISLINNHLGNPNRPAYRGLGHPTAVAPGTLPLSPAMQEVDNLVRTHPNAATQLVP